MPNYESAVIRFGSLEALRGVAALIVMFFHALILSDSFQYVSRPEIYWSPFRIFWAGHQAVILFFVLSGVSLFIMFESMLNRAGKAPAVFIVSRWIRLYPVYIFSIGLSIFIYWALARAGYERPDQIFYPPFEFEGRDIWGHASLVGLQTYSVYNPPVWSIVVEMRISILFPLLYFGVRFFGFWLLVLSIIISIVSAVCVSYAQTRIPPTSLFLFPHYTTFLS